MNKLLTACFILCLESTILAEPTYVKKFQQESRRARACQSSEDVDCRVIPNYLDKVNSDNSSKKEDTISPVVKGTVSEPRVRGGKLGDLQKPFKFVGFS